MSLPPSPAPIATGWSDSCRAGFAPARRRRLSTAHLLMEAIREANAIGNLVFDAQIVALCRESGISRLVTEDRDFDRFKDLSTERLEA